MTIKNAAVVNNGGNAANTNTNTNATVVSPKTGESVMGGFVYVLALGVAVVGLLVWRKKTVNEPTA